ncbi:hypothetical protein EDI_206920 [Entamoeba dispar SAW760]|uniref:Uncharacterized protein n=1 Tax=Entamoeba dispar (strain ATCC PRA-260 / SAW760) TaxID=370354 RepID=B0EL56_ENTDS|nr:uncharacterized protein EDI_206920 [Entamoeba dispar SAW760]EDR24744.1 hypothetical protein EDI_206920 [Entamoeba dispar SAW760]|eukprot:EDR24744.1 hypothetical protein EDI_206920 [Entamoeba dispar SAW760]
MSKTNSSNLSTPQPTQSIKNKHPIFKESTSPRFQMMSSSPLFQNLEYNHMTKDLQEKYGTGIKFKNNQSDNEIGISEALNIMVTMIVCGCALGFIGYGYGGPVYAGLGGAIGIFIGMIVDTLLVIIYSNKLGKHKSHSKYQQTQVTERKSNEHKKTE